MQCLGYLDCMNNKIKKNKKYQFFLLIIIEKKKLWLRFEKSIAMIYYIFACTLQLLKILKIEPLAIHFLTLDFFNFFLMIFLFFIYKIQFFLYIFNFFGQCIYKKWFIMYDKCIYPKGRPVIFWMFFNFLIIYKKNYRLFFNNFPYWYRSMNFTLQNLQFQYHLMFSILQHLIYIALLLFMINH